MQTFIVVIFTVAFSLIILPTVYFFAQIAASSRRKIKSYLPPYDFFSTAVIIPAHNEEKTIAQCLVSTLPQMGLNDVLIVVADNCTDSTAEVARSFGAHVVERVDKNHIGKGYALHAGVESLRSLHPQTDVIVFIDADCTILQDSLPKLTCCALAQNRPAQAHYHMIAPDKSKINARLAEFAWCVKNLVRPRGCHRLDLPCQLMGSGMAIPMSILSAIELATSNPVEDMQMGLDFAAAGYAPIFCEEAKVVSFFPDKEDSAVTQKTRWLHGHIQTIFTQAPRLLKQSIVQKNANLFALICDLCIPPLTLLVLANAAFFLGALVCLLLGYPIVLLIALGSNVLLLFALVAAWEWHGQTFLAANDLSLVFYQVLTKVPFYLKALIKRQSKWVRTSRD